MVSIVINGDSSSSSQNDSVSGSSSIPTLTKVNKGATTHPELVKVERHGKGPENQSETPQEASKVPELVKVDKFAPPALNVIKKDGVNTPPPLEKKASVVAPTSPDFVGPPAPASEPPPLVQTKKPQPMPPLVPALKKKYTGLVFEFTDEDDSFILNRVVYGNELENIVKSEESLKKFTDKIVEKEMVSFKEFVKAHSNSPVAMFRTQDARLFVKATNGSQLYKNSDAKKVIAVIICQRYGITHVPVLDPVTRMPSEGSSKERLNANLGVRGYVIISVENDASLNMDLGFVRELLPKENEFITHNYLIDNKGN